MLIHQKKIIIFLVLLENIIVCWVHCLCMVEVCEGKRRECCVRNLEVIMKANSRQLLTAGQSSPRYCKNPDETMFNKNTRNYSCAPLPLAHGLQLHMDCFY